MRRLRMRENNSELWNLLQSYRTVLFVFLFLFYFIFFFTHFCVNLFSGQDEVRTSNPVASVVRLSAFRSHAPTTQPSRRLKVYQLLNI